MHRKMDSTQTWKWGHGPRHPEDSEQMMTTQSTKAGAQGTGHEKYETKDSDMRSTRHRKR